MLSSFSGIIQWQRQRHMRRGEEKKGELVVEGGQEGEGKEKKSGIHREENTWGFYYKVSVEKKSLYQRWPVRISHCGLVSMKMWVGPMAPSQWVKDLALPVSCGVDYRYGLGPLLLWLWCRLAATAPIRPLAWELLYAPSVSLKSKIKKKKKKKKANEAKILVT